MERIKSIKLYGVDLPVFLVFVAVVLASCYMELVPNQLIGAVVCMFTIGIILGEIGERIPIWNKYCGGGGEHGRYRGRNLPHRSVFRP